MNDTAELKLAAARTKLILDKPFLGALALRLPMIEAHPQWCPTTATDTRSLYFNRNYIDSLSLDETQFILAHEALHCALSHFTRRNHRLQHRWDLACDLAINPLLREEGLQPPANTLIIEPYQGMTAEEIYPLLSELDDQQQTLDQHLYPQDTSATGQQSANPNEGEAIQPTSPAPPPPSAQEMENLATQWHQRLVGAAQLEQQAGKLGSSLARLIDLHLEPQLPWRSLLAHHLLQTARDDFSYMRPSRREGSAILPSLRSHQVDLIVAIDTSGSVREQEIGEFLAEVHALKGQLRARATLLLSDSSLSDGSPQHFEPWEEFSPPTSVEGGGGTDFRPVFEWAAQQDLAPGLLIYFTDGKGPFPADPPNYPVIWLIKGKEKVPWGQRIQLN